MKTVIQRQFAKRQFAAEKQPHSFEPDSGFADLFVTASDGVRLYARAYGSAVSAALPVVCLPGLARTAADFHDLARHLSEDPGTSRRVLALDYRGRGNSGWSHWRTYDVRVEAQDVLQVLTAAGIHEAVFVGTSRGGLIAMAVAAMRPTVILGAVLNDVGPVVDPRGLIRIRGYVGKLPAPKDYAEGALILKSLMDAQFPRLGADVWMRMARQQWKETTRKGKKHLVANYDPALMKTLRALDLEVPLPPLWPLFDGLKRVPVLALRGANSDILSETTLNDMAKRHPRFASFVVPDQGHAPLLIDEAIIARVTRLVRDAERGSPGQLAA